jgi:hypothetical protein
MPKRTQSNDNSKKVVSRARPSGKGRSTRTGDAPGRGHVDTPEEVSHIKEMANPPATGQVGSSEKAAADFGGKNDFGIPAIKAHPGQQTDIDTSTDARPLGASMPLTNPDDDSKAGFDRSTGEDVDDREAATGAD